MTLRQHMSGYRPADEIAEVLLRAKLREERRHRAIMRRHGYFSDPEGLHLLDLSMEAGRLVRNLYDRLDTMPGHDPQDGCSECVTHHQDMTLLRRPDA